MAPLSPALCCSPAGILSASGLAVHKRDSGPQRSWTGSRRGSAPVTGGCRSPTEVQRSASLAAHDAVSSSEGVSVDVPGQRRNAGGPFDWLTACTVVQLALLFRGVVSGPTRHRNCRTVR